MGRTSQLILALYTLSALMHAYVGARLLPALPFPPATNLLLLLLLVASTYFIPTAMIRSRREHNRLNTLIIWCGLLFMGLLSSLFVFTALRDLLWLSLWLTDSLFTTSVLSAAWISTSAVVVLVAGLLLSLLGLLSILLGPAIVKVDIPIANLPAPLQGFSLAQLTDIHIGPTIKRRFLEKVVRRVNQLEVDAVVITGDLVDGRVRQLGEEVQPLAQLHSRYGTYFVTGNHEYYSNAHEWIELLKSLGLRALLNEHEVIQHNQRTVVMAGITDYSAHQFDPGHQSDPQRALRHAPQQADLKILLAHQPRSIFQARGCGAHVQLSGHTHGGQFWPWNHFVPLQQPYTSGLHWFESMWIYVSRGTGYWGPPKRFGAPAEITLLRFTRADPA
ncbi:MAG: metallophosphoesterase [Pseudomonadota bacterium]|nr:metallophosphoesterase [Pseudomonadota bacterium]